MEIELRNLAKRYGHQHAVHDLSIGLAKGEMMALLGPSGCGKTTTLRMIAGFIEPSAGQILFQGRDVTRTPPHKRDTGLVFQSYALFPHMTVTENIAFGLKRRGVPEAERAQRIAAIVGKLKLDGLEQRLPRELSGGQQQRVAVARALVINPAILLLDEPFSNLDAKLRESTGLEMRRLQRELGLTSVFVTHDQLEAMSIADRIAVMNQGKVEQIGSATEIYERPATRFVADFIGNSNFLPGRVEAAAGGTVAVRLAGGTLLEVPSRPGITPSGQVSAMIRPEHLSFHAGAAAEPDGLAAVIEAVSYQGPFAHLLARLDDGGMLTIKVPGGEAGQMAADTRGIVRIDPRQVRLFAD